MIKRLVSLAVASVAATGFADGPININNFIDGSLRSINFPTAAGSGGIYDGTGVQGAGWIAQFVTSDGTPIGGLIPFRTGTQSGRLDFRAPLESAERIVPGNPGDTLAITVRVWDTSVFPTWDGARDAIERGDFYDIRSRTFTAAGFNTFNYTIPGADAPLGADRIVNFQGFNLTTSVMPEPGTIALGIIGVISLLWHGCRLKKRQ
jgi:hypothetical protein